LRLLALMATPRWRCSRSGCVCLKGAQACFATATGMSAVFVALAALLGKGDRVVSSRSLFGSCFVILDEILPRWGVETVFSSTEAIWTSGVRRFRCRRLRCFFESPSNPMQELVDMAAVCDLAHGAGAQVVVDNVFGTPVFSKPLEQARTSSCNSRDQAQLTARVGPWVGRSWGPAEFIDGPVKNLMRHIRPVECRRSTLGAAEGSGDAVAAGRAHVRLGAAGWRGL